MQKVHLFFHNILQRCKKIQATWLFIFLVGSLAPLYAWGSSQAHLSFVSTYDFLIQRSVKRWWADYPDWKDLKAQYYQESKLDPNARSWVGAEGIAQFMPATWIDIERRLGVKGANPREARYAIDAGAYYMASLRRVWHANRTASEQQFLAQASYNTGTGNVLKAQIICKPFTGGVFWESIYPCLHMVTGNDAQQTIDYVKNIVHWRSLMGD